MDKLNKKTENITKKLTRVDAINMGESFKHVKNFNFLTQSNLNAHNNNNPSEKKAVNGAKKLTPLTVSRSSSSSNRYQTAAMAAAIDFDYLEEKLKQIQANSDQSKKLLPTNSTSHPTLKSSIKPITPRKTDEKANSLDVESNNNNNNNNSNAKKINFKLKDSSSKKELQRSISNMDHQRPVTTSTLKQKLSVVAAASNKQQRYAIVYFN